MTPRSSCYALLAASLLASLPALTGCSGAMVSSPTVANAVTVKGNWQFSSNSSAAARLPVISGELSGSSAAITGIFHSNSASACVAPNAPFSVSGSADRKNHVTLTGTNVAGGTITLTGTLADDGKSLSDASYTVSGGTCAFAAPAGATAQAFNSVTGRYTGVFTSPDGDRIPVIADLTQTPESDTSGNFSLSGTGTFPYNPCFNSPVSVSNAQVTGGSFTLTYSDQTTGNTVTGTGTFSPDASTLTVSGWQLAGTCGPGQGTGVLTRQ